MKSSIDAKAKDEEKPESPAGLTTSKVPITLLDLQHAWMKTRHNIYHRGSYPFIMATGTLETDQGGLSSTMLVSSSGRRHEVRLCYKRPSGAVFVCRTIQCIANRSTRRTAKTAVQIRRRKYQSVPIQHSFPAYHQQVLSLQLHVQGWMRCSRMNHLLPRQTSMTIHGLSAGALSAR